MLTTQIQVLLYVGNIQVISCSVFVPVPSIVVKSHQTLEAILPYLPLSLTSLDPEENNSGPDPLLPQPALPAPPESPSNTSTALTTTSSSHSNSLVLSTKQDIIPSSSSSSSSRNNNTNTRRPSSSNSNRISPDSSIPATTCIKISLQPTPSFKFVKPKCPHQHQKSRNRRHLQQQHQQQQQSASSSSSSHSHSHSHSHHHGHNHNHSHHQHRSDSHRHSHSHNHSSTTTNMASLEYSQQTSATAAAATAVGGTITIKFTYPVPSANSSTPIPEQVQVTGTFNAWQRSQPLTCNQDRTLFEADIPIDLASLPPQESSSSDKKKQKEDGRKKILFKFVLDGQNWVTDPDQPTERDYAGNVNNVLFINNPLASPPTTTVAVADKDEPASSAPLIVEVKAKTETETEEEKAARLKQEAEDDETIRQLGGGMWGAPFFAVNDPVALPEHFADADDQTSETAKEAKVAPIAVASKEQEKEVEAAVTAISQEVVAEKVQTEIEADVSALQSTQSTTATIGSSSLTLDEPKAEPKVEVVEDEDDKIIKALGGGMWGTPFFKVNDPAELPEHFQEALKHNAATATVSALPSSTSSSAAVENEEKEEVTDKDGSDSRRHSHIQVVKDEVKATVEGGNLIETVVETTEDTVITAADGTFLEESITTTVEDTISGVLEEEVTEVIETIEEEDAPSAAAAIADESGAQVVIEDEGAIEFVETIQEQTDENDTRIPDAGTVTPPEVTMTETETTTSIQGEDGVETTIVEDTLTFTDGPEVDASSLHSLTTAIKPVTEGESVVVEQSPEVLVAVAGFGDAKPSVDESIEAPLPTLSSTTVDTTATPTSEVLEPSTPVPGKVQPLQDVVPLPQDTTPAGDAKPTADLSVATTPVLTPVAVDVKSTLPTHLTPDSKPVALTTVVSETTAVEKSKGKTEKSEKRKSFWKKVKKVLS